MKPRRTTASGRLWLLSLAKCFDWSEALVVVQPETFVKWHRSAFRAFWRWTSRRVGRPRTGVTAHPTADWTIQ
jgi:putative transposase